MAMRITAPLVAAQVVAKPPRQPIPLAATAAGPVTLLALLLLERVVCLIPLATLVAVAASIWVVLAAGLVGQAARAMT
jgi:hypothetical protein